MNPVNKSTVDPLIADVVAEINAAGFETYSSCQGKTVIEDWYTDSHCVHSFLSFGSGLILYRRRKKIKELGLRIYNGNTSVTALSEGDEDCEVVMRKNRTFPDKLRKLFNLPDNPADPV